MFNESDTQADANISERRALRHLVIFQVKLVMDAIRDFALSPLSILAFIVDAIRKPTLEDSLYLRLMKVGRHSDRVINLFDEYADGQHYTVDETLAEVEEVVTREVSKDKQK